MMVDGCGDAAGLVLSCLKTDCRDEECRANLLLILAIMAVHSVANVFECAWRWAESGQAISQTTPAPIDRIQSQSVHAHISHPLQFPLLSKFSAQAGEILDQILACLFQGLLGRDASICLHTKFEVGEEGVWDFVAGEGDSAGFEELCAEEVAESVVFFVEEEHGCVRNTWGQWSVRRDAENRKGRWNARVSVSMRTHFSPGSRQKSSNLHVRIS